jgi:hypothetical protein
MVKKVVDKVLMLLGLFVVCWNLIIPLGWQGLILFVAGIIYCYASYGVKPMFPLVVRWMLWGAILGWFLYLSFVDQTGATLTGLVAVFWIIANPPDLRRMAMQRILSATPRPNVSEIENNFR